MHVLLDPLLYQLMNQWHWIVLTTLPVGFWFYEKEGAFPYRSLAILLIFGDVMSMSFEHVLHSPKFYWHASDLDGVDECFLVAWFSTLTLLVPTIRYWMLALLVLPVLLGFDMVRLGDLSWEEALYAIVLGVMVGSVLSYSSTAMQRLTFGIEQLLDHHGSVFYPFVLLVLFDINQNLIFFTASFHFMFGYGK